MDDTPSLLMYYHLQPWLQGNLAHIRMDFNFDDVPHNDFGSRLGLMLDAFETGKLQEYVNFILIFPIMRISFRCTQFFVVITTHSDPTTGYLHLGPNNVGSVPVEEVAFCNFIYLF